MRVRARIACMVAMALTASLTACGDAKQPNPASSVRIKLPPAKPAAVEPGFSSVVQPAR
jgi:hypothetical protein